MILIMMYGIEKLMRKFMSIDNLLLYKAMKNGNNLFSISNSKLKYLVCYIDCCRIMHFSKVKTYENEMLWFYALT